MSEMQVNVSSIKLDELEGAIEKVHTHSNLESLEFIKSGEQYDSTKFLNERGDYITFAPEEVLESLISNIEGMHSEIDNQLEAIDLSLSTLNSRLDDEVNNINENINELNSRLDLIVENGDGSPIEIPTNLATKEDLEDVLTESKQYTDTALEALKGSYNQSNNILDIIPLEPEFNLLNFKETGVIIPSTYYGEPFSHYYGEQFLPQLDFSKVNIYKDSIILNWALIKRYKTKTPTMTYIPSVILSLSTLDEDFILKGELQQDSSYYNFIYNDTTKNLNVNYLYIDPNEQEDTKIYLVLMGVKVLKAN